MKYLFILLAGALFACNNSSNQAKIYEDSATYYSNKLAALADSGFSTNDSTRIMQEGRRTLYEAMRLHYMEKAKEAK